MCDIFGRANKISLDNHRNDFRVIHNYSMYLARVIKNRPSFEQAKTVTGQDIVRNLEVASDLLTPTIYTPPDGMLYNVDSGIIRSILAKYKLDDSWFGLDAKYRVPRWDYMQLLYLWDWTDKKQYIADFGDCDKFAWIFRDHFIEFAMINGIMFVIDYSGRHSYELLFDLQLKEGSSTEIDIVKSKLIVLEPQSDEWEYVPIVTEMDYIPNFPKYWETRNDRVELNMKGYPLKDCKLIM